MRGVNNNQSQEVTLKRWKGNWFEEGTKSFAVSFPNTINPNKIIFKPIIADDLKPAI